jgi:hypothetical protein
MCDEAPIKMQQWQILSPVELKELVDGLLRDSILPLGPVSVGVVMSA